MNNTEKFTGKSEHYANARPDYPAGLFDWIFCEGGLSKGAPVADIGSGTGIFAKSLLTFGARVYAVEPNDDMRNTAETALSQWPEFISVKASAEHTDLSDHSVSAITAAQAFHWFDVPAFQTECRRILKPGGKVFLVWNHRIENAEPVKASAEICRKYCPNFSGFSGGRTIFSENMPTGPNAENHSVSCFFNGRYTQKRFANDLLYTEEKFTARMLSSSYALLPGDPCYDDYVHALRDCFLKYAKQGVLSLPNETVVYAGLV